MTQRSPILSYQTPSRAVPYRIAATILLIFACTLIGIAVPLIVGAFLCFGSLTSPGMLFAVMPAIMAISLTRLAIGAFRVGHALWHRRQIPLARAIDLTWQFEGGAYIVVAGALMLACGSSYKFLVYLGMPSLALAILLTYTRFTLRAIQHIAPR